jgi:hypothetical protein
MSRDFCEMLQRASCCPGGIAVIEIRIGLVSIAVFIKGRKVTFYE